jgi:hypothetical protein
MAHLSHLDCDLRISIHPFLYKRMNKVEKKYLSGGSLLFERAAASVCNA